MKRRKWNSKTKAKVVLEGLGGRPVAEICNAHGISQTQYYKWREQFLAGAHQAFEGAQVGKREARQRQKISELQSLVGELTMELKKSETEWYE